MKAKLFLLGTLIGTSLFTANAQQPKTIHKSSTKMHSSSHRSTPSWGKAHKYNNDKYVYFQDYYTFYSPKRGYVYWNNGSWTTSQNMPQYMSNADLNGARMQILNDESLSSYPERNFPNYMNQYPSQPISGLNVPVPQAQSGR